MWVCLTRQQLAQIQRLAPPAVVADLSDEVRYVGERQVQVNGCYIAWRLAIDALSDEAFGPYGGRRKNVSPSIAAALRRVTARVNEIDRHPALREVAMVGRHGLAFPAWRLPEPDDQRRLWSPAPLDGAMFAVLKPRWVEEHGSTFTVWGVKGVEWRHDRTSDPDTHWAVLSA